MVSNLVGAHVVISELGIFMFAWAFLLIFNPDEKRVQRAKKIALIGVILFFVSWVSGGYYYVDTYGPDIKPVIKAGPQPWAHSIVMEAKEHIFLMLPFLGIVSLMFIRRNEEVLAKGKEKRVQRAVLILLGLTIIIGVLMAGLGYLISAGYRTALEAML